VLKKMEIGLITVSLDSPYRMAEIIFMPDGKPVKHNKIAEKVKQEIAGRSFETAGGTQKKVNTAYRERCVRIACLLDRIGPLTSPELIKLYGCEKDAYALMHNNQYGWFRNTGKGRFALTKEGREYLDKNSGSGLVSYYRMKAEDESS
jgi:hypothetical protein